MTTTQNTNDLDALYVDAAAARLELLAICTAVASANGGEAIVPELKGAARAAEKIALDYNGDASRIRDLARASIVVDHVDGVRAALAAVSQAVVVVEAKDRFARPVAGYRDILLTVRCSNGHLAEVQIHVATIAALKAPGGLGHLCYEVARSADTVVGQLLAAACLAASCEMYNAAFVAAGGSL